MLLHEKLKAGETLLQQALEAIRRYHKPQRHTPIQRNA